MVRPKDLSLKEFIPPCSQEKVAYDHHGKLEGRRGEEERWTRGSIL